MARVINIISGKGGTGKSTFSINLASALNDLGEDVLLIDADIETPNVAVLLGATDIPFTLTDYMKKKNSRLKKAIYKTRAGFKILPAGLSYVDEKHNLGRLKSAIRKSRKLADYILIDCPPGVGKIVRAVLKESDESIILTNPELIALTDNIKAIKISEMYNNNILGVVVNKVTHKNFESLPSEVESMLDYPIIGAMPNEKSVKLAMNNGGIVGTSKFAVQVKKLAANLAHKEYIPEKISFWEKLMFWK